MPWLHGSRVGVVRFTKPLWIVACVRHGSGCPARPVPAATNQLPMVPSIAMSQNSAFTAAGAATTLLVTIALRAAS